MELDILQNYIGDEQLTIVDAMRKIDINSRGVLYIVNNDKKLVGTLTDGDIRRWILKSGKVTELVSKAMNSDPKTLSVFDKNLADEFMIEKSITSVPIVNGNKEIEDIVFLSGKHIVNKTKGNLNGVPAIIMAGGKGTRLYPYTKILPKPLVPVGDTPIIERIIDYFRSFDIQSFYVTVNYKKNMIKSYFDDIARDYIINYVEENMPLGTGGSIKLIKEKLDKPIFVTNCDTMILADYHDLYQYHIKSGNDITVVSALKTFQIPYGVIQTGENGQIESMEEKPKLTYFINTGMYVINPAIIDYIPDNTVFHMTHLVETVMENGGKAGSYPISEDSFLDMGELDELKRMEEKLQTVPQ